MIAGVVLAAGEGRRFPGVKQLAPLRGRPLLEHALATVEAASLDPRFVVLGAHADEILERVDLHGAEPVLCDGWAEGQAAALRAGIDAVADAGAEAAVVILGDQPLISPAAIARLLGQREPDRVTALRASYSGVGGHPVILERAIFDRVAELSGDAGARELLRGPACREVPCDGLGSDLDIDTAEQLDQLRSSIV